MRLKSPFTATFAGFVWAWSILLAPAGVYAQSALPTPDQLDQLLAPIALYPDALVAQICAELGQETMYLEFTDSVIEFISPREEL